MNTIEHNLTFGRIARNRIFTRIWLWPAKVEESWDLLIAKVRQEPDRAFGWSYQPCPAMKR